MITMDNMLPIRDRYSLLFEDNLSVYTQNCPSYYWSWIEYVFELMQDMLLSNEYIKVTVLMRNHRIEWLENMVESVYAESIESVRCDLEDDEENNQPLEPANVMLYNYLYDNPDEVTSRMFNIANYLIYTIFHPLYNFVAHAKNVGMTFTSFILSPIENTNTIQVSCITNIEVIKRYDKDWYDRLSLLAAV